MRDSITRDKTALDCSFMPHQIKTKKLKKPSKQKPSRSNSHSQKHTVCVKIYIKRAGSSNSWGSQERTYSPPISPTLPSQEICAAITSEQTLAHFRPLKGFVGISATFSSVFTYVVHHLSCNTLSNEVICNGVGLLLYCRLHRCCVAS